MSRLLLKYPSRGRPELFRETLPTYLSLLSGKHECRVVISCDEDDASMNNPVMREWIANQPNCQVHFNPQPQTKISAVNANMEGIDFDVLILCSDDMIPEVRGYDDRIVTLFQQHFPDGDDVLHLNDGLAGRNLNTLCICDKKYYDRFGYIYHSDYRSLFADDEWQAVSESLGRAAYVDEVIIRHRWIGHTKPDALHLRNESFYQSDMEVYRRRKAAGFPK